MAANSSIEWTEATWNPLAGCTEVSPGCQNCYAAVMAKRLEAMGQKKYAGTTRTLDNGKVVWTGKITLDEQALHIPLKRKKPTMYFVNSMSDLFHEDVTDRFIESVFHVMARCPQHTFQVLTKRAQRLPVWFKTLDDVGLGLDGKARLRGKIMMGGVEYDWPLKNVWIGVSVEDQARADERIPLLLQTPATVRFLSCEPLLCAVNLHRVADGKGQTFDALCRKGGIAFKSDIGIDWVIVGGESGHGCRPCNVAWIRSIVEQCKAAGVACFVKQLGEHIVCRNDEVANWFDQCSHLEIQGRPEFQGQIERVVGFHHHKVGDPVEWPSDLRVRQFPRKRLDG